MTERDWLQMLIAFLISAAASWVAYGIGRIDGVRAATERISAGLLLNLMDLDEADRERVMRLLEKGHVKWFVTKQRFGQGWWRR